VTPDNFPTREAYLKYVKQCEDSIIYSDTFGNDRMSFDHATEDASPAEHTQTCVNGEEGYYCWCMPDEDGLRYNWARGMTTAAHVTSPMFTFKFDHNYEPEYCGWCRPEEFYWDDQGQNLPVKEAEERWWADYHHSILYSCSEFLGLMEALPPPEPDKIGPHP
jgi:hypothetical protein